MKAGDSAPRPLCWNDANGNAVALPALLGARPALSSASIAVFGARISDAGEVMAAVQTAMLAEAALPQTPRRRHRTSDDRGGVGVPARHRTYPPRSGRCMNDTETAASAACNKERINMAHFNAYRDSFPNARLRPFADVACLKKWRFTPMAER